MKKEYDITIIGGGIAGITIAEIFSRNGYKVCLIEKNKSLCKETSGSHHGWFHFGSLYSIFPGKRFLVEFIKNLKNLIKFYSFLPGMNITINSNGKLEVVKKKNNWIRNENINYIVASRNDPDFNLFKFDGIINYIKKLFFMITWEIAIKRFVSRHNKFHKNNWNKNNSEKFITSSWIKNYAKLNINKIDLEETKLDSKTHFEIKGFDKPMNSTNIVGDLVKSILSNKGKIILDSEVKNIIHSSNSKKVILKNQEIIKSKIVVITAGKFSGSLIGKDMKIINLASPLLVVYPSLSKNHFVRMTPFVDKSINHICHKIKEKEYSLIGGGHFADPNDSKEMKRVEMDLIRRAKETFLNIEKSKIFKTYFSYKSEYSSKKRNYLYAINKISDNFYSVVPGKFTLSFSLAINFFKSVTSKNPVEKGVFDKNIDISKYIKPMIHAEITLKD